MAKLSVPLTDLLKKDVPFVWGSSEKAAFAAVKSALSSATQLMFFLPNKPTHLATDALDGAIGSV